MPNQRKPGERKPPKEWVQKKGPPEPDGKVHVARILTPDPSIFPPKLRLALQYYLDTEPRDAQGVSKRVGMPYNEFLQHLKSPGVLDWLKKQEEMIDEKVAELRARARVLTHDHLDAATVDVLESKDTPSPQKVRMIEVGYRRFGLLKDKSELTGANGAPLPFQLIRIGGSKKESDGSDDSSSL